MVTKNELVPGRVFVRLKRLSDLEAGAGGLVVYYQFPEAPNGGGFYVVDIASGETIDLTPEKSG